METSGFCHEKSIFLSQWIGKFKQCASYKWWCPSSYSVHYHCKNGVFQSEFDNVTPSVGEALRVRIAKPHPLGYSATVSRQYKWFIQRFTIGGKWGYHWYTFRDRETYSSGDVKSSLFCNFKGVIFPWHYSWWILRWDWPPAAIPDQIFAVVLNFETNE